MAGQSGGLIGTQIATSTQAAETTTINSSADITLNAATNIATVLIIAGGGGGGSNNDTPAQRSSGGGGAGGYRTVCVTGLTGG